MIKIETTQNSFLLKYGAKLIVLTELFIIFTIIILYKTNGELLPTLAMLFLAPLLGGIITGKISKKNDKKVLFKDNFNKSFIIANIIAYAFTYLFNFRLNIMLVTVYIVGAIIGFSKSKKSIEELKNNTEAEEEKQDKAFSEGEKIKIKEYKLEKFDGENIKKFLKMNNLEDNNYLLAQIMPTAKDYILYGYFSLSKYIQFILHFDEEKLYFFELSRTSNKSIKNGFAVEFKDLQVKKAKKGLINYRIHLEFNDESKVNIQIPKKVIKMYAQKQYGEKLYNKCIEIKNNK